MQPKSKHKARVMQPKSKHKARGGPVFPGTRSAAAAAVAAKSAKLVERAQESASPSSIVRSRLPSFTRAAVAVERGKGNRTSEVEEPSHERFASTGIAKARDAAVNVASKAPWRPANLLAALADSVTLDQVGRNADTMSPLPEEKECMTPGICNQLQRHCSRCPLRGQAYTPTGAYIAGASASSSTDVYWPKAWEAEQ